MKFRLEYMSDHNVLTIHLDKRLTSGFSEIYKSETDNENDQPEYIKKIWQIEGIDRVVLFRYQITIFKAEVFKWTEEAIKKIILALLNDFESVIGVAEETAPPIRWFFESVTRKWYRTNPQKSPKQLLKFSIIKVAERKKKGQKESDKKSNTPPNKPKQEPPSSK